MAQSPLMADLMAGPNAPLSKAFLWCGWACITVDWLLDPSHDLSHPLRQASLHEQLQEACFLSVAMDCSTKSRAREIPRQFADGRPAPQPLRSEQHPEGLPNLSASNAERVRIDNEACAFLLKEVQQLANRGGASVRENPWRSLHWHLPMEREMMRQGIWRDKHYSACVFAGARCKSQRLRHNLDEIDQWPPMDCHHSHDPHEWDPHEANGQRVYPSHEEAEYTAPLCFAIAVAASWWACRTNKAKLHVPRMPAFQCGGRREHWLSIDSRCMREWAMAPLAISLGLRPKKIQEASRIPARAVVADVIQEDGTLPAHHLYVGPGSHTHRLATTKWKSPFVSGHNCPEDEWLIRYVDYICSSSLWSELPELEGWILTCDCPWQSMCEADILSGLFFEYTTPRPRPRLQQAAGPAARRVLRRSVVLAAATPAEGSTVPPTVPQRWSQEAVTLAFRKLFPAQWFEGFSFPFVEDLINQHPFSSFPEWLSEHDMEWDQPLGPHNASRQTLLVQRHAEGQQAGAHSHRAALPPLFPFGLSPDDHFKEACRLAQHPLPFEQAPILDQDLQFAASLHARVRGHLRRWRQRAIGALRELKQRWQTVTLRLRQHQEPSIQLVTRERDLGLTALLVVLTSWADTGYPFGLITGLPAVGYAPAYGVFPSQPAYPLTLDDVLVGWESHNQELLSKLRPGKDDEFLLKQSTLDAEKGFCTFPLSRAELLQAIKGQAHRLIPRCVITQSSGKQRVIDNADTGGQSERSQDANKLQLCSPFRPAQQIAITLQAMSAAQLHEARAGDAWQTGGEDWPDAYRHSPMSRQESCGCVVAFWHHEWQKPAFQLYGGLLFGLPLAVTSFNRYSKFVESQGRRLVGCLVSMYFDDASLVDWASSKGSAQWAFSQLNLLLGTPFAEEKKQQMASQGTFLGLTHDLSEVLSTNTIKFWVRDRLQDKMITLMQEAMESKTLRSGIAAKLYGVANFFEQAVYGRIGCGGLAAIKQRQYESISHITPAILSSFHVLQAVIQAKPERPFPVLPQPTSRFCAASDAALEIPGRGTGGFLLVWFDQEVEVREAFVAHIPPEIYLLWEPGDKKIAQLEMMMVLYALVARPRAFRHRRGLWLIDNIAALMCLVRGRSESPDLERISSLIHLAAFSLQTWLWWEYIQSKSNWADSISRLGLQDPWHRDNHFTVTEVSFPIILWHLPFTAVLSVFAFL